MMYKLIELEDIVKLSPEHFGEELEKSLLNELRTKYEGKVIKELQGIVVFITEIKNITGGDLYIGDPSPYYKVTFNALVFSINNKEVFNGIIEGVSNIGLFVNIGSFTVLVHISQISDKRFKVDEKNKMLISEDGSETYTIGNKVRIRIIGVSYGATTEDTKVAGTMRQPGLGKI